MRQRIMIDGAGNAGTAVIRAMAQWPQTVARRTVIEVNDLAAWRAKHAQAGLIPWDDVGLPKAESAVRFLRAAGWPEDQLFAARLDVRDRPRAAYRNAIVLALTDSHALKHESVLKALQAGSSAIAVGLASGEAVIECFRPGGAGYCCVHGTDPSWSRRQPCQRPLRISATDTAWRASTQTVLAAGQAVAEIVAECLVSGHLPGGFGLHLRDGRQDPFWFGLDPNCFGPHDPPCRPGDGRTIRVAGSPERLTLNDLLSCVGANACYLDRELAWVWHCRRCGRSAQRVHTVHPAALCGACSGRMQAGLERASGLTAAEVAELDGRAPTLADLGLAEETLLRCLAGSGEVVWVELERS